MRRVFNFARCVCAVHLEKWCGFMGWFCLDSSRPVASYAVDWCFYSVLGHAAARYSNQFAPEGIVRATVRADDEFIRRQ